MLSGFCEANTAAADRGVCGLVPHVAVGFHNRFVDNDRKIRYLKDKLFQNYNNKTQSVLLVTPLKSVWLGNPIYGTPSDIGETFFYVYICKP